MNGASDLMVEVLGDKGRHARAAVGVSSLPLGCAVEVDAVLLDRDLMPCAIAAAFLKPIAHRGLHDAAPGHREHGRGLRGGHRAGYGIECDVRAAAARRPWCSTTPTLERLIEAARPLAAHDAAALKRSRFADGASRMIELAELLELVGGRVPLLVEIKSEWDAADPRFLATWRTRPAAYRGPIGLMSFDPAVIVAHQGARAGSARAASCPASSRATAGGATRSDAERAYGLTHLLEFRARGARFLRLRRQGAADPGHAFRARGAGAAAVHLDGAHARRTRQVAARWADAPIFEGYQP